MAGSHPHIMDSLGEFMELLRGCLSLTTAEDRFALRKEELKFHIVGNPTRVEDGKGGYRQQYYSIVKCEIENGFLVIQIGPEFEVVEGTPRLSDSWVDGKWVRI